MTNTRGSITLFVLALLPFLLVFAGLAVDLGMYMTAQGELQTTVEAAALAGAGTLDFTEDTLDNARMAALTYSQWNGQHLVAIGQSPVLDPNTANDLGGDVVLGVWDPDAAQTFRPSLDRSEVNAVLCQKQITMPTTFLRLIGIDGIALRSQGVATANPPNQPPGNTPEPNRLPIVISGCPFQGEVCDRNGRANTREVRAAWYQDIGRPIVAGERVLVSQTPPAGFTGEVLDGLAGEGRYTHVPVVECINVMAGELLVVAWAGVTIVEARDTLDPTMMSLTVRYDCVKRDVWPRSMAATSVGVPAPRAGIALIPRLVR